MSTNSPKFHQRAFDICQQVGAGDLAVEIAGRAQVKFYNPLSLDRQRSAVTLVAPGSLDHARMLKCLASAMAAESQDESSWQALYQEADTIAEGAGAPRVQAMINLEWGRAALSKRLFSEAVTRFGTAVSQTAGDPLLQCDVLYEAAQAAIHTGAVEEAWDLGRRALVLAEGARGTGRLLFCLITLRRICDQVGDLPQAIAFCRRLAVLTPSFFIALGQLAQYEYYCGNEALWDKAAERYQRILEATPADHSFTFGAAVFRCLSLAETTGRGQWFEVADWASTNVLPNPDSREPEILRAKLGRGLAAAARGDSQEAGRWYRSILADFADPWYSPEEWWYLLGTLAHGAKQLNSAKQHLQKAWDSYGDGFHVLMKARTALCLARVLIDLNEQSEARRVAEHGLRIASSHGMIPYIRLLTSLLAGLPPNRSRSQLTPRKTEVLRLLPSLRDKEIAAELDVSAATVATHVRHIYAKIGVGSRAEAAAYAARDELNQNGSSALT